MSNAIIKCSICKKEKPIQQFEHCRLKKGIQYHAKSCQPCRDIKNARYGSQANANRRKKEAENKTAFNKLMNWPLVT